MIDEAVKTIARRLFAIYHPGRKNATYAGPDLKAAHEVVKPIFERAEKAEAHIAELEAENEAAEGLLAQEQEGYAVVSQWLAETKAQLKELEWVRVEYGRPDRGLPEIADGDSINSDLVFITAGEIESTEVSFYNYEEKEWQGDISHPTHWRKITLPSLKESDAKE